ncbi:hypothetical protein IAU60_003569 [Kwoniella sp. DSM 27419]
MNNFPPFPPNQPGRGYGDRPPFPPSLPPPPPRDFAPYPYPTAVPPPPSTLYRPYDNYAEPPRPTYRPYEQPGGSYGDRYDPYQPANSSYNSGPPPTRTPVNPYAQPPVVESPANVPFRPARAVSPPRRPLGPSYQRYDPKVLSGPPDLALVTNPTTVSIGGFTAAVHSVPSSHLPITKYIALNRDDAIDLHRSICSIRPSVWYADGSSRAGEGWSAAIEWKNDSNRSGSKMRGFIIGGDALESELGGIYKAAEGFRELLHQSIKDGIPISHELTVFCDSQAALIAADTSARPEALKFDQLWRDICTEYPHAHMTLAWIPKDSGVEGHTLADKVATVGASNSYLKRRKERTLSDMYMRPGGGDPEPSGSVEPGPWQRGNADPSHHPVPFHKPRPPSPSPGPVTEEDHKPVESNDLRLDMNDQPAMADEPDATDGEDEGIQPREGAVFVTHFPHEVSAKDIGILFAQYGEIVAVDIFHISSSHPRFANVTYRDPASGLTAIDDLHRKHIRLDSAFAVANKDDLQVWKDWDGQLTVVLHEPPRIVPSAVEADFPDLPDWARGVRDSQKNDEADTMEVEGQIKEERSLSPELTSRKRDHSSSAIGVAAEQSEESAVSALTTKRPRHDRTSPLASAKQDLGVVGGSADTIYTPDVGGTLTSMSGTESFADSQDRLSALNESQSGQTQSTIAEPLSPMPNGRDNADIASPSRHLTVRLGSAESPATHSQAATIATLPPTPVSAQRPINPEDGVPNKSSRIPGDGTSTSDGNSAAEAQESPLKISAKTLVANISLVRQSLAKHDRDNWIVHACVIASDIDHTRRALQADLHATDECSDLNRDLERTLAGKGFTGARVDTFVSKVLKVLDGIAAAEEPEPDNTTTEGDVERLTTELEEALEFYPNETKNAISSAGTVLEYLLRGKELQEKKRLEVERRVKVLEGMVKVGEVVGGVVRYLLTDDK